MKKRDVFILVVLIALVVVFTGWERLTQRGEETEREQIRRAERVELEERLADYDLHLDSLSTAVLRIVDSLRVQAAVFESLAKQTPLEVVVDKPEPDTLAARAQKVAPPPDTLPQVIHAEYERALASLPADLTRYEQKIARKEVENTILVRYGLTREAFAEMKKSWSPVSELPGGG